MNSKLKIGITGATGGIGHRLTELLVSKQYDIKALVRETSNTERLAPLGIEFIYGDINDRNSLSRLIQGTDVCYHLAAQVADEASRFFFQSNVRSIEDLCDIILTENPSCTLVHCSSIATLPVRPSDRDTLSDYVRSKYEGEKIVEAYIRKGLKATIICPGFIYGPHDRMFVPKILEPLERGVLKFVISGGERNAAVIYMDDLAELFYLAGVNEIALGKKYLGVKPGDPGIHDFIRMLAEKMNFPPPVKVYPRCLMQLIARTLEEVYKLLGKKALPPLNTRAVRALSCSLEDYVPYKTNRALYEQAEKDLGWRQMTSMEEGIEKTINWLNASKGGEGV